MPLLQLTAVTCVPRQYSSSSSTTAVQQQQLLTPAAWQPLYRQARTCWVQHIPQWVEHEGECTEEANEGDDAGVEQRLGREHVGQLQQDTHKTVGSFAFAG